MNRRILRTLARAAHFVRVSREVTELAEKLIGQIEGCREEMLDELEKSEADHELKEYMSEMTLKPQLEKSFKVYANSYKQAKDTQFSLLIGTVIPSSMGTRALTPYPATPERLDKIDHILEENIDIAEGHRKRITVLIKMGENVWE